MMPATTNPHRNVYPHARRPLLEAMQANRMQVEGWTELLHGDGRVERLYTRLADLRPLGERYVGAIKQGIAQ